jgi:hypothetical protein
MQAAFLGGLLLFLRPRSNHRWAKFVGRLRSLKLKAWREPIFRHGGMVTAAIGKTGTVRD